MGRKQRAMIIGAVGAGKSTLVNALLGKQVNAIKTQSLLYYDWLVDTPGEYTENPMFYKSLMATALEVTHVLYLQDATRDKTIFPPGFALGTSKLPIGVITKIDDKSADIPRAFDQLKKALIKGPIIYCSAKNGIGIEEIKDIVNCSSMEEIKYYCSKVNKDIVHFIK